MNKQSTIIMLTCGRFGIGFCAGLLMLAIPPIAHSQDNETTEKIQSYIQQLDSSFYLDREQAATSLASFGIDAVRPLAIKAVSGSPESKWRAKQILELIGVSGNEETFLKTANILKLLYMGASESLNVRISELQVQWKLEQKRTILNQLKARGARVIDPSERTGIDDPFALGPQMFFEIERPMAPNSAPAQKARFRSASMSLKDTLNRIDTVMTGTVEQNRVLLLKDMPKSESEVANENPFSDRMDRQILLQMEMRRRLAGNRFQPGLLLDGITIVFDDQWKGDEADLQRLNELSEIRAIEIKEVDLSEGQLKLLTELKSLSSILIAGNELSDDKIPDLSELKQLSQIHFLNRKIGGKSLSRFRDQSTVTQFVFENCDFQLDARTELARFRFAQTLAFISMPVEPALLDSIGAVQSLRMVNLELCKFQTAAYRQLRKKRPDIEINFTPQAMLGVRPAIGPLNGQGSTCEIAQIISNSGAEKGGMLSGDIVRKINGQAVEEFEDLRLHVAQHKAGDTLDVTVERAGKAVQLKVQLMPFQMNE